MTRSSKFIGAIGPLLAVALGLGCSDRTAEVVPTHDDEARRFAEALCAAAWECGCTNGPSMNSIEECTQAYIDNFQAILKPGDEIDQACLSTLEDTLASNPCLVNGTEPCPIIVNDLEQGAPCLGNFLPMMQVNQCAEGLACLGGICMPNSSIFNQCYSGTVFCGLTTYCGIDGVCYEKRTNVGDTCEPGMCQLPLYCHGFSLDEPGACAERIAPGDVCEPTNAVDPCSDVPDASWCDPAVAQCEAGTPPPLCEVLNLGDSWRAAILNGGG